jgi:Spy/CpxP family protein refolding chaperone
LKVELTEKEYQKILKLREEERKVKEPPILEKARDFVRAEDAWIRAINTDNIDSDYCRTQLEKAVKALIGIV